ncbi:MAG: hypothetical protein ACRED5_10385 [Propylenella sp.]
MNAPSTLSLRVGVTGHRMNKLRADETGRLKREVRSALALLRRKLTEVAKRAPGMRASGAKLQIVSPLAEGADRIVATAALDEEAELIVLLPFARDEYARDFADRSSREEFFALLGRAAEVVELEHDGKKGREIGYARVGALVVERSDVLIALWDGAKASGAGGTAQIVALARRRGRPILWLPTADAAMEGNARSPRLLLPDRIVSADATKEFAAIAKTILARQLEGA